MPPSLQYGPHLMAALMAGSLLSACVTARAEAPPHLVSKGERIARENCAGCHAMTAAEASPLPDAPTFPALRARYDRNAMAAVIAERMEVLHPRMPRLQWAEDETAEFLTYWAGLEPAPAHRSQGR